MKRIAEVLGVSRSNFLVRRSGRPGRVAPIARPTTRALLPLIHRFVDERPTMAYRRIPVLVNRALTQQGLPIVNRKRGHRIMRQSALLLEPHTGRREGRISRWQGDVMRSNAGAPMAWSSPAGTARSSAWPSSSMRSTGRSSM